MAKILCNLKRGLLFILSGPAGTGKTTLVRMLLDEFDCLAESVSCTTRKPRPGEVEGKDYFFLTHEEFQKRAKNSEFLEQAEVFRESYGTLRSHVEEKQKSGKHVLLVIDTQGAKQLRAKGVQAAFIFISPPSMEELEKRLHKRKTENKESLQRRLSRAPQEMADSSRYDYHIVNEELSIAYEVLKGIVVAEEHRVREPLLVQSDLSV